MPEPSITCPRCRRTSYNPNDIAQGYCGYCHWWTSDAQLGELWIEPHPYGPKMASVKRARHGVEIGLTVVMAGIFFMVVLGQWVIAIVSFAVWLVCAAMYVRTRRLERCMVNAPPRGGAVW